MKGEFTGLGPLTRVAVSHLRDVVLIASTPTPEALPEFVDRLKVVVDCVANSLHRHADLRSLTIDFPQRRVTKIFGFEIVLTVEALQVEIREGQLVVVGIAKAEETSETKEMRMRALNPLCTTRDGEWKVRHLVLGNCLSNHMKQELEFALKVE